MSFLVLPAPAHKLGLESAARALELMARALPAVIAGFRDRLGPLQNLRLQDEVGEAVRGFAEVAAEAKGERIANLAPDPDPSVLARTMRRLRHDLVMLGRAAAEPLPAPLAPELQPLLDEIGASTRDYLRASADALTARREGPTTEWVDDALAAYFGQVAWMRRYGQLTALPLAERGRIFALGFALQQLRQNLSRACGRRRRLGAQSWLARQGLRPRPALRVMAPRALAELDGVITRSAPKSGRMSRRPADSRRQGAVFSMAEPRSGAVVDEARTEDWLIHGVSTQHLQAPYRF